MTTQITLFDDSSSTGLGETLLVGEKGISPERVGRHVVFHNGCVIERILGFTPLGDIVPVIMRLFPLQSTLHTARVYVFKEGLKAYSAYPKGVMYTEEYEWSKATEGIPLNGFIEAYIEIVGRFSSFDAYPYTETISDRIEQIKETLGYGWILAESDNYGQVEKYVSKDMLLLTEVVPLVNDPITRHELWREEESELIILPDHVQCQIVHDQYESKTDTAVGNVSVLGTFHDLAVSILNNPATDGFVSLAADRFGEIIVEGSETRSRYFQVPNQIPHSTVAVLMSWVRINCGYPKQVYLEWSSTCGRAVLDVRADQDFCGVIDLWACAALTQDLIHGAV